jgi:ferredoxin
MLNLKKIRFVVAVLCLLATTLLFFDIESLLKTKFDNIILGFQFVPSMLKFIRGGAWVSLGFIVFSLLSLIFGRLYCSFICPLGILQDALIRFNRWVSRKKKTQFTYRNSFNWLRHLLVITTILSMLLGSTALLIWLDPYSNFGRMASHILQPIYLVANNLLAILVNKFDYYGIYHIELRAFDLGTFMLAISIFLLLVVFTRKHGRFFCNTLCPVGGWLSWIAHFSLFKLQFDANKCISCGLCEKACKAENIDYKNMQIDFDRCVACFNCVDTCSVNAISYQRKKKVPKIAKIDNTKRSALKTMAISLTALSGLSLTIDKEQFSSFNSTHIAKSKFPVMPPGALSLEHYKETCTACHLCVSACPSNVLQSTFTDFGLDGMFIPKMNFDVNYCQYECNLCGQVCPTGAIKPMALEQKKTVQMGKVTFVKDNCVVSQLEKDCGACAEHCPTKAIKMVPYPNKSGKELFIPEVNTDLCIGCGACEHPCPVRPHKAIYVEGNLNHQIAQKPVIEKMESTEGEMEDFPF